MKKKNHNQFVRYLENIQDLSGQKLYEYAMLLNGNAYSRKTIKYNPKTKLYSITNHIDNSKQVLSKKQILNKKITLIGEAMIKRSLIALID